MLRLSRAAMSAIIAVALTSACSSKRLRKPSAQNVPQEGGRLASGGDVTLPQAAAGEDQLEPSFRGKEYVPSTELQAAQFDYDATSLSESARQALRRNAEWLRQKPEVEVQVQGHCDERGTAEYNLALGQRRAQAVRDYYKMLGLRAGRIGTISYGEERPACRESDEACWARNRRAVTLIRK